MEAAMVATVVGRTVTQAEAALVEAAEVAEVVEVVERVERVAVRATQEGDIVRPLLQ